MSHPLHEHIAKQIGERLRERRFVVWYDPRRELVPFVVELRGPGPDVGVREISIGGVKARLAEYDGSFFLLRSQVEPFVVADDPEPVLVYVPGVERDERGSVLMELELAGTVIGDPHHTLEKWARAALRLRFHDGAVDDLLAAGRLDYQALARASSTTGPEPPSLLEGLIEATSPEERLAIWLTHDAHDAAIEAKGGARAELAKLVRHRLGLELESDQSLPRMRTALRRYLLAGEFRADLRCPPPASLAQIPAPSKDQLPAVQALMRRLRGTYPAQYVVLADAVEIELRASELPVAPEALGSIDTFRFEERALLRRCDELIVAARFDEALAIVGEREDSFWLKMDVARNLHWKACRYMAELGRLAAAVRASVAAMSPASAASAWVEAYTRGDGWYRLDQAQRRLETWVTTMDDSPAEHPLNLVRRAYLEACEAMAQGFSRALERSRWAVAGVLHQTRIHSEVLGARPTPAAYFMVDALRYEMGRELVDRLQRAEVSIHPAITALPSITPVGMAALLPGAAGSFSVVEHEGKLAARIEDGPLPDLPSRRKRFLSRAPGMVDIGLDELLGLTPSRLRKKVEGAPLVVVRSQEIDHAGETGFSFQARHVMDSVIDNLAKAIKKLAAAGIEHSVVTADHGHLFHAADMDPSMRIEAPGGNTVDLHRRCWIGRGGATPGACQRVDATLLGYEGSDLELVFPRGTGVFKAGGDLMYHHGGISLQEMVIPVLTVRLTAPPDTRQRKRPISLHDLPEAVTVRVFTVKVELEKSMFTGPLLVRPLLQSEKGLDVGQVGMALDAEHDRSTGCVSITPGRRATIAFVLTAPDGVDKVRILVQDPSTDAELCRSPEITVRLGVS